MSVVAAPPLAPYKGLAPFEDSELDALLFFGREREREVIVANMLASRLTVLYGPSGVGKSSLLRAGVARRLREAAPNAVVIVVDGWLEEPFLPQIQGEGYLILDQFEEYFLYHGREGPLEAELPALLERPDVNVLLSLREDALAKIDSFQGGIPRLFANRLRLDRLDPLSARAAIVGPLDRYNALVPPGDAVLIESALVDAVLEQTQADVSGRRKQIEAPYLQLVLERIWEEERTIHPRMLTLAALERLGGARAIVREHLEGALEALPARDAEIAAGALRFLVTPSRTKIAHTVADLAGYAESEPQDVQRILETLATRRVLRAIDANGDGTRYEIFHDVLVEPVLAWRQQADAQVALARERRRQRRLLLFAVAALTVAAATAALAIFALAQRRSAQHEAAAARASQASERRAAEAAQMSARNERRQRARADTNAARALHQARLAAENARQTKREASAAEAARARAQDALRVADVQRAKTSAAEVRARASAAQARTSAAKARASSVAARAQARRAQAGEDVARATATLATDPVASVRSALAAAALEHSGRVEDALRASLVALRVRGILPGGGGAVADAVFSPDGRVVATGAHAGIVRVFSTQTHRLLRTERLGSPIVALAFSDNGDAILSAGADGQIAVGPVLGGTTVRIHSPSPLAAAAFAGPRAVVAGGADGNLRVWDAGDGMLLHEVATAGPVGAIAVSPDGRQVAVASPGSATVHVVDVAAGIVVASPPQQGEVTSLAFSPDGSLLATGGRRNAYVWATGDWSLLHVLKGHAAPITSVDFADDGRLVTTSEDSSARVWNAATGDLIFILSSQHQQKVLAAAVSPDGSEIATASADRTARLWPAPLGQVPIVLAGHGDSVTQVSFSRPDGRLVLTASDDGTARLWDATRPALAPLGSTGGAVTAVQFSPDRKLVLAARLTAPHGSGASTPPWCTRCPTAARSPQPRSSTPASTS